MVFKPVKVINVKNVNTPIIKTEKGEGDIERNEIKRKFSPFWRQSWPAFAVFLASLPYGFISGFSAIMIAQLEAPDSPIIMNTEVATWIGSLSTLGMAPGGALGGWMMDKIGRKKTQKILALAISISFVIVGWSNYLYSIYIGRLLCGLFIGMQAPAGPALIGETAQPGYRSFFLPMFSLGGSVGILLVHSIGIFTHWRIVSFICAIYTVSNVLIFYFVPESPLWLIKQSRIEEGKKAFLWYRGDDEKARSELQSVIFDQSKNPSNPDWKQCLKVLKEKPIYKPLSIVLTSFLASQLSGYIAVAFYAIQIIRSTLGSDIDQNTVMIIVDIVRLLSSLVGCILLKNMKRRSFTFLGYISTSVALFGLSLYLILNEFYGFKGFAWIPMSFFTLYIASTAAFVTPIPWTLTSELLPMKARGFTSGICTCFGMFLFFIVSKLTPLLFEWLSVAGTYAIFGCFVLGGCVVLFFALPETKGKSLSEIAEYFQK